ncbi:probable receptor-like protein kinase [Tanacetum coccineum]|uniref:non-specific serine/threonine protein kinase n=1 Tax=Tanacetum coccineum TaxID=301880 RepID=A0ABQ5G725_9ASTR
MLVYEYVDNGNLKRWLHGDTRECGSLTWEARMKVILGIAKALSYLHEAIEPKGPELQAKRIEAFGSVFPPGIEQREGQRGLPLCSKAIMGW